MDRVTGGLHDAESGFGTVTGASEIVFIDPGVHDVQALLSGLRPGIQIVLLSSEGDALDQIAQALSGQANLSAIHIISEGSPGQLDFAAGSIDAENLTSGSHASDLAAIRAALGQGGDLLLWGCNVAQGEAGQAFVSTLAGFTGVDVAASTNMTGAAFLGGDWTLETRTGHIETAAPLTAAGIAAFGGELAPTTLSAGDVAIIGYNTGQSDASGQPATTDSLSFVLLQDIGSGTTIYFTDRSWNGSSFGAAGGGEGTYTYTAGGNVSAGTVITVSSATLSGAGITMSNSGDNFYVYQGTDANTPTKFLFAMDYADGDTTFGASLANTGLTNGLNALAVDLDSGAYSGPVMQQDSYFFNGTDLAASISDADNWTGDNRDAVNALVQPVQDHFLLSPDIQIWGAAAGGGDGIIGISADSTTGLATGINKVQIYTYDGTDDSAAAQNLFLAPRDLVIDTVHGKFFVADSDLAGNNRILQGNLSDLLGNPGTVPTLTVLCSDATSGVNSQFRNLVIDPDHNQVFFSHGGTASVQRVNYDTANQTAITLVNLGAGNGNGNNNNFVDDFVINFATGHIYITSHRVTAAQDGDGISRNFLYDASGLTPSSNSALAYSTMPFNPDDDDSGVVVTPGEAFPREHGSLEGLALSADGSKLYFATASVLEDTDGDGKTGGADGGTAPVVRPGGIFSYDLTGNTFGNFTTIWEQTFANGTPKGLFDELEIDPVGDRYYFSDTTGGTGAPGDEGIWVGSLSGGTPTFFAGISNINGLLIDGYQLNRAPTLNVTNLAPTYTEVAGAGSGFGTPVGLASGATAADADTTNFAAQMAGAIVRISSGFQSGAAHADRLTINGNTSGTVNGITYGYDSTSGVMKLTGATTFANYQTTLNLIAFSVSGDNPTNYGANQTRTFSWSVSDGLVSSDEKTTSISVVNVNDAAIVTAGNTVGYTEQTAAVVVAPALTATDADNLTASSATVTISSGLQAGDTLHFTANAGTMGNIAFTSYSGGVLTLTSSGGTATLAQWQVALRSVTFDNTSNNDPAPAGATSRTVTWVVNDGTDASTGVTTTINITGVNDAPTLTATGLSPTILENENQTAIFNGATVDTIESGQNISSITLTISGVLDGADELLQVDGLNYVLSASVNTAGGITTTMASAGAGAFTVTISSAAGLTPAAAQTLINGLKYWNNATEPTSGDRVITITKIVDNGGVANTGHDTTAVSIVSTAHVFNVNDAPTLTANVNNPAFSEGVGAGVQGAAVNPFGAATGSTVESGQFIIGLKFTVSGLTDGVNEKVTVAGTTFSLTDGANGTTATDSFGYSVSVVGNTATVTLTNAGVTGAEAASIVSAIQYQNTNIDNPIPGNRIFTLTEIKDNGGIANNGHDTTTLNIASTVSVVALADAPVAKNDALQTNADTVLSGDLTANNSFGPDSDADGPGLTVDTVNGSAVSVGTQIALASGALLTVNSDGTFAYDPNHKFDTLAASGSGASNITDSDTFTYTLTGGSNTATAVITIAGVNNASTIYEGSGGNNLVIGDATLPDLFHLEQGGDDTAVGGSADDGFYFGAAFDSNDNVSGGGGSNNQIGLEGDYSGGITISGSEIANIQVIAMLPGFDYTLATDGTLTLPGQTFTFWSVSMGAGNHVAIDVHLETGNLRFFLGQGGDTASGGTGTNLFYGEGGADRLTGNTGVDTFAYLGVTDSHGNAAGSAYDTVAGFTAGTDHFKLAGVNVTVVENTVNGSLSGGSFETDLTNSFGPAVPNELAAGHAVIFHVTGGGLSGRDFLIVNAHGVAGYSAGADYVIDVTGMTGTLAPTDFA